jgi:hypothetical protein
MEAKKHEKKARRIANPPELGAFTTIINEETAWSP